MSKIEYLKKTSLFAIRYFACPFVIVFCFSFFALTLSSFLVNPIDFFDLIETSAYLSVLASAGVLLLQLATKLIIYFDKKEKEKPSKPLISIKTRIELKKYYFSLSVSMLLSSFAVYLHANPPSQQQNSLGAFISFMLFMASYAFFALYREAYKQKEKAMYYLETTVKNIEYCLEKDLKPYIWSLENGLKGYQNTMAPSHSLRNLKSRIKQVELVFERGTREEISKVRDFVSGLVDSMKKRNTPAFDEAFSNFVSFLDQFEDKKKDIVQIDVPSRRELVRKSFLEFFEIGIKKAIPYLIIVAAIALLYVLFGIPINVPFG